MQAGVSASLHKWCKGIPQGAVFLSPKKGTILRDKIALTEHGNIPLLPRKVKQRGCESSMGEIKKMRCV